MKCISLWQPWTTLVVTGAKRFETRSWPTSVRGVVAIHAAKKWTRELDSISQGMPFVAALARSGFGLRRLPLGEVIGTVEISGCERVTESNGPIEPEACFGDFTPGRFMWKLERPTLFARPFAFRGAQGFFDVPDELVAAARGAA